MHWPHVYQGCYDMSTLTGTLAHALLGVLAEGPRTGYGLVKHLEQSIAYTWPASHTQVYPELAKLREAGLIRESGAAPRGGRLYALTDAGLEEVRRWLRETEPSRTVRDESALRLFFLWLLEPEEAEAYLRGEAERARAVLARLEEIAAHEDPATPKTRAYRVALELGLRSVRARAEWAEWASGAVVSPP
ncbi:MAG TPA: PadR family transcriptional regulator [Solirubrobacteraceae bacterium]|nr:PadR family transcriptional regulator [Solirubrobacteraceae bacterium]